MRKRGAAFVLAAAMLLSVACSAGGGSASGPGRNAEGGSGNAENGAQNQAAGAQGGQAQGGQAQSDQAQGGQAQSGEKETLQMMAVGGSDAELWMKLVEDTIARFNEENSYNVEIEMTWYENEQYKTKFATLMTQNNMADIFFTWEYGFLQPYAEAGKVYDMTDALNADKEWKDRFDEGTFIPTTFNGRIYGLPTGRQMAPVYYNKQIFADCGVEVPETWDEFLEAVRTFKDAGIVPIVMATRDPWVIAQFFLDITGGVGGMELFEGIQTGEVSWDDPRYVKSGQLLQEIVEAGAFPENFSGLAYEEGLPMFTSGRAAMFPMGTWMTAAIVSEMDPENVGVFLPPAYDPANCRTHLSQVSKVFGISETCKNKEAAMAFLKLFSEDDIQEKVVTELGMLPAVNTKVDTAKIDSVTSAIIELADGVEPLTPFDVLFGTNIGVEFNNIALAIATGKDSADQFAQLQAYTESQKE